MYKCKVPINANCKYGGYCSVEEKFGRWQIQLLKDLAKKRFGIEMLYNYNFVQRKQNFCN